MAKTSNMVKSFIAAGIALAVVAVAPVFTGASAHADCSASGTGAALKRADYPDITVTRFPKDNFQSERVSVSIANEKNRPLGAP